MGSRKNVISISLVLLNCLVLCTGCVPFNYFPSSKITVHDVFGNPIGKISVTTKDLVAVYPGMEGFSESVRPPLICTTDQLGVCSIPGRFRFAMPFASGVYISVNQHDYNAGGGFPIPGVKINGLYSGVEVLVDKGKDVPLVLQPFDIDYRLCNSITDTTKRAACFQNSIFFSAVREGDPNICKNYDFNGPERRGINDLSSYPQSLQGKELVARHYWGGGMSSESSGACYTVVALKINDNAICENLSDKNPMEPGMRSHCLAAFNDPEFAGMVGVSNSEFRHFLCNVYDSSKNQLSGKHSNFYALEAGINLYKWSCQEASSNP